MSAWHENCILRDDVRRGTLTLADFAADLYGVRTGDAPNVYRLPNLFFDRTYPTHNLKTLVRDVLLRLSGSPDGKPVIRVQVAYGGGKTHALIALLHLAEQGNALENHQTVQEFMGFSGLNRLPQARVALLPFDKFDVLEGLSVRSPEGESRQVKTPWGALAYQLAGDAGLEKVSEHEATYVRPAEPILVDILKMSQADGASPLILIDEALMYLREVVNKNSERLGTLQDFFQMLTQAVAKVERASLVASLISSESATNDPTGVRVLSAMEHVFRRVEETVEPLSHDDISELLRRRLFEDVGNDRIHRPRADRLVEAMRRLRLRDSLTDPGASNRFSKSYPFHPDFIEVFYQKWTQLNGFQKTRGMLRTFATALREADGRDAFTFVGPGALLGTGSELSKAVQELIEACEEGNQWTPILTGELERARTVQEELPQLKNREIEAAVLATFLHSQPQGKKAETAELYLLLAHPEVDAISLEKGLSEWRKRSWFLKEEEGTWALGTAANLTNMHVRAMGRVTEAQISEDLEKRIRDAKLGQNRDKVAVHAFPNSSADVSDTPELHFVIAGPEYATVPGEDVPSSLKAFFEGTYRNSVVVLAPERSQLTGLRQRIRKILGWTNIEQGDDINLLSDSQKTLLRQRKREDSTGIGDSVIATYSVLIAVDEDGSLAARSLSRGTASPFERVKELLVAEDRLLTTSLDPDLLTAGSYYELWNEDETAKPVQVLYGMFASLPRMPRLLNRQVFIESLRRAVEDGQIVLRAPRPDGTHRTYWREAPADEDFWTKGLEIGLIEPAELYELSPELLPPGQLPDLWPNENIPITVGAIREFFSRDDVPKLASDAVLLDAVKAAVQSGILMARSGDTAYLRDVIPDAELTDDLELLAPLTAIRGSELSPDALPDAWEEGISSVGKVMQALAQRKGSPIPWALVVIAINEGLDGNLFKVADGSVLWPSAADAADKVVLQVSQVSAVPSAPPSPPDLFDEPSWGMQAASVVTEQEIQDLAATIGELAEIAPEIDFVFYLSITARGEKPSPEVLERINETLRKAADELKFNK